MGNEIFAAVILCFLTFIFLRSREWTAWQWERDCHVKIKSWAFDALFQTKGRRQCQLTDDLYRKLFCRPQSGFITLSREPHLCGWCTTVSFEALADDTEAISEEDTCNIMIRGAQYRELMPTYVCLFALQPMSTITRGRATKRWLLSLLDNQPKRTCGSKLSKISKWKSEWQVLRL